MNDLVGDDGQRLRVPGALRTEEGRALAREIARERWCQYMLASRSRVLGRLAAKIVIVGVEMELEPWRIKDGW